MFNQHAKWLKVSRNIPWRKPIASLNYLLMSHVWRQDHNGFSHEDRGFIDHIANKKSDTAQQGYLQLSFGNHSELKLLASSAALAATSAIGAKR
jgi:hypothetical protein